ncbi:MAG: SDR family oxidoreductase [Chloroflexi bacterium]|nr:SDR family oxidoreductase [Chloroflexota bacterium]
MAERILITGGAQRLGLALARAMAAEGHRVAIHTRRTEPPSDLDLVVLRGDLDDPSVPAQIVDEARARLGGLSVLVNNAARFEPDRIDTFDAASFDAHMATNLRAPLLAIQAFAASLGTGEKGLAVNIVDQKVRHPGAGYLSYTLSKIALEGAVRALAADLAPRLRVTAIAPGIVYESAGMKPGRLETIGARLPLRRAARPEEVAAALTYLIETPSVTGETLFVDSGESLRARSVILGAS